MASINELINLSRYQSGDLGREGLNGKGPDYTKVFNTKTPEQKKTEEMNLQMIAAKLNAMQYEAEVAKRKKEIWDNFGANVNKNKTTPGVVSDIVDNEDSVTSRDANIIGNYEPRITPSGDIAISRIKEDEKKPTKYDHVKVVNRAMKMIDADLAELGVPKSSMKASDYSVRLQKAIPEARKYLGMDGLAPTKADNPRVDVDGRPVNITGLTSSPEDFLPEYKEKRGMIEVAKDFYFGGKKNAPKAQAQSNEKVMIITPDGKRGFIPKSNLEKALQRGAKIAQ